MIDDNLTSDEFLSNVTPRHDAVLGSPIRQTQGAVRGTLQHVLWGYAEVHLLGKALQPPAQRVGEMMEAWEGQVGIVAQLKGAALS